VEGITIAARKEEGMNDKKVWMEWKDFLVFLQKNRRLLPMPVTFSEESLDGLLAIEAELISLRDSLRAALEERDSLVQAQTAEWETLMAERDTALEKLRNWESGWNITEEDVQRVQASDSGQVIAALRHERDASLEREAAALRERDEARGQLCRVQEWCDKHGFDKPTNMNVVQPEIRRLLSSSAPCAHAEELKVARETVAGQETEIREGDYWMERARQSFANGTCPCCFCTDEGPHDKGCAWAEYAERVKVLEEALNSDPEEITETTGCYLYPRETDKVSVILAELRRRGGKEGG
jgi:hypothetical protein